MIRIYNALVARRCRHRIFKLYRLDQMSNALFPFLKSFYMYMQREREGENSVLIYIRSARFRLLCSRVRSVRREGELRKILRVSLITHTATIRSLQLKTVDEKKTHLERVSENEQDR